MKKLIDKTLFKFIVVGVINTLVGMAIMFSLYNWLHCNYWFSSSANYVLTSILSFFLNKYFTFQSKEFELQQVIRFVINIAVCYFLAYGIAKPAVYLLLHSIPKQLSDNIAMFAGMCLFTGFNYIGQRFFTFKSAEK